MTENKPKALLPISGKPIIDIIIEKLDAVEVTNGIFVSINKKFEEAFMFWQRERMLSRNIELVVEETREEKDKLGSIGGLVYLIARKAIDDDLLVIAGDNLFDFDLVPFIKDFKEHGHPLVALYDMKSKEKVKNKFGVVILGDNNEIIGFEEKPSNPHTSIISTGIYIIPKDELKLLGTYISSKQSPDAFGYFIKWLAGQCRVRGYIFSGQWYDIGSFALYDEAQKRFNHAMIESNRRNFKLRGN